MNKPILYHVSHTGGLTELTPHVSTHGVGYVYATTNLYLALLFGSYKSNSDLDGIYGITPPDENGESIPFYKECYKDALKKCFAGISCSIYIVDPTNFEEGKTSFPGEVVSKKPVKVLKEIKVKDIYKELKKAIENNKFGFTPYSNDPEYKEMIRNHIKNRIILYEIYKREPESNIYRFCMDYYPDILKEVEEEMLNKNSTNNV